MEDENNAFYVVRKGDVVGIFRNLSDCQAQVGVVSSPPVSVYKGYALSKEAEEHIVSHGLKNAAYVISAAHVQEDLFGTLVPCPFQQPDGLFSSVTETSKVTSAQKRSLDLVELDNYNELAVSSSVLTAQSKKHVKLGDPIAAIPIASNCKPSFFPMCMQLCGVLAFDGASKGNPGKAGAGVVLRTEDGSTVWRLREGLGIATNNVAEYRAMILGLKFALKKGFKKIHVQGDSKIVCMQMQGLWRTKNQNMIDLWKEAKELKDHFQAFKISHIDRPFNSEADAQANLAVNLDYGEIREVCDDQNLFQM